MGPLQAERVGVIRMEATRLATSIYPSLATWPLANILQRLHESTCPLGASWSRHLHAVPPTLSLLSLASVSFGEWPNSDKTKSPSSFLMFFPSHLYFHFLDHSSDVPSQIFITVIRTENIFRYKWGSEREDTIFYLIYIKFVTVFIHFARV